MAEDRAYARSGVVTGLVLRFESARSHSSQGRAGSNFNKALEVVLDEEEILSLDPPDRGGELVGKKLNKDGIREGLALCTRTPFLLIPALEDLVEARAGGLVIDDLNVFLRYLERLGDKIGDVFSNEHVGVKLSWVDLLGEIWKLVSNGEPVFFFKKKWGIQARNGITPAQR